jgi:hypothetical protein
MEQTIINSNTPAMSENITALASAFLLAQPAFKATGLDGNNTFQKIKYATIGAIYKAVKDALFAQNIIIWHFARPTDGGIEYLYTRLIHTLTGQYIEDCRILESEKPGNQAKGSANTYMKKYAVLSLCAIPTEDDDGEDEQKEIVKKEQNGTFLTKKDVDEITHDLKGCANAKTLHDMVLQKYKVTSLQQLPYSSYDLVKQFIEDNGK